MTTQKLETDNPKTQKTLKQDERVIIQGRNYYLSSIWVFHNSFGERESDPETFNENVNASLRKIDNPRAWMSAEAVMLTNTPQIEVPRLSLEVGEIIAIEGIGRYKVCAPTAFTKYRQYQIVPVLEERTEIAFDGIEGTFFVIENPETGMPTFFKCGGR